MRTTALKCVSMRNEKLTQDIGSYYAWGETAPKNDYSWSTYFDTEDDGSTFLKYNLDEGGKTVLDPEDDAASVALGGDWRMPSRAEQDELRSNCYWVWTSTYGGKSVNGYIVYRAKAETDKGVKVTSSGTPSSNYSVETDAHVFLPAAGSRYGSDLYYAGGYGHLVPFAQRGLRLLRLRIGLPLGPRGLGQQLSLPRSVGAPCFACHRITMSIRPTPSAPPLAAVAMSWAEQEASRPAGATKGRNLLRT